MFSSRKTHKPNTKKQESWPQSSSRSWSQETESQKQAHTPSPENDPHLDKPERKRKKLTSGKSETPKGPSKMTPKAEDKIAQEIGEDVIRKYQEEEDKQDHQSRSKKSKRILTMRLKRQPKRRNRKRSSRNKRRKRRKRKKPKNGKKERSEKLWRLSAGSSSNN